MVPELLDLPRKHKVALAMIDHPSMPRPAKLMRSGDIVTSDFVYARMSGGPLRHRQLTKTWSKSVVDRSRELT